MGLKHYGQLVVVAVVAFAIAFAAARLLADDGATGDGAQPQARSYEPVTIDNLDRVPQVKPLRSQPGAPPEPTVGAAE